jgi:topoisomerase IA-like protein
MENPQPEQKSHYIGRIDNMPAYLNFGKFGHFIKHDSKNYKVPSFYKIDELTLDKVIKIINNRKAWLEKKQKEELNKIAVEV